MAFLVNTFRLVCIAVTTTILISKTADAQSHKYRNRFEWPKEKPDSIGVDPEFKNEDAVILLDETEASFFDFQIISRHLRIKYLTKKGLDLHGTIKVPESLDPEQDYMDLPPERRNKISRPKISAEDIVYFSARIIKPDGKVVDAVIDETTQKESVKGSNIYREFFAYFFKIKNLEVNDEVEVSYCYNFPLSFYYRNFRFFSVSDDTKNSEVYNLQHRFFFHGLLPKQNYQFTFRYRATDKYIFDYQNGALSSDSSTTEKVTEIIWRRKNLQGGLIAEKGARLYKELPYIRYYWHAKDYGIMAKNGYTIEKYTPYSWQFASLPYVGVIRKKYKNHINAIDNLITTIYSESRDTSSLALFKYFHQTVVEKFDYQDDQKFFKGEDLQNEKFDKFIKNKTLREVSRYNLYNVLMHRLNTPFYSALLHDKRLEDIDFNMYFPPISGHFNFCLYRHEHSCYFYPKQHRFGYDSNELPFYEENTNTILNPQTVPIEDYRNKNITYYNIRTPSSNENDNVRNTKVQADVLLDSCKVSFNAKIDLYGQFSTMTRGKYQYNYRDSSCSDKYAQTIYDNIADVCVSTQQITSHSSDFPFKTQIHTNFSSTSILKKTSDKTYSLDVSNWFKHIIYDDFSSKNRQLGFYPDFKFRDIYTFLLKFDSPVALINVDTLTANLNNNFGAYVFKLSQPQPDEVLIESHFLVKSDFVPAEQTTDVEAIYSKIQQLNLATLNIQKTK